MIAEQILIAFGTIGATVIGLVVTVGVIMVVWQSRHVR